MKNNKIKVLLIKIEGPAEVKYIENELHEFQNLVGGYIETLRFLNNSIMAFDEEGRIKAKPHNSAYKGICGDFFVCNTDGTDFTSLTEDEIKNYQALFNR